MKLSLVLAAAAATLVLGPTFASADDLGRSTEAPCAKGRTLVFGDGVARVIVERDRTAGRMRVRLADPAVKVDGAPVVVMTSGPEPRELALVPVDGQTGVWTWTHDAVKADTFDGSMRLVVAGKPYTAPLATVWTSEKPEGWAQEPLLPKARYGGRIVAFTECGASVEVVHEPATGTLTIYPTGDLLLTEAPEILLTGTKEPVAVKVTQVEGKSGVWTTTSEAFKSPKAPARIKVLIAGKACETPLVYGLKHGGRLVVVPDGPSFEVVSEPTAGSYTFYAVDDTFDGKPYTVESPKVVYGTRTYELTPVPNEPRAWRLVGLDTAGSDSRDGQLNFTLFGKTLSTRLGLDGLGIGVK